MRNASILRLIFRGVACFVIVSFCGCGADVTNAPASAGSFALAGRVHGGQQPVVGATIQLYAAGTNGYGSAAAPLLNVPVLSTAGGAFSITGDYTCPSPSTQVYIAATGGNPGLGASGTNPELALITALGACGNLSSSTFININELTTVAAVWSLAPFMSSYSSVGTSATNLTGLSNAFASAGNVVSFASGAAPGPTLPAGATLPVAEIDSLANILSSCVNSSGGTAGDGSACGALFAAATPVGGTSPVDTVGAALAIARNPAHNVSTLFALSAAVAPFQPTLSAAPSNWLIGINYTGGGLNSPAALAVDAQGQVWVANAGNSSLTGLGNTGASLSPSNGFVAGVLNAPAALAIDSNGYLWIANRGNSSLSKVSNSGILVATYTGGGLNLPDSIAIDANGNLWIADFGSGAISEFNSAGVSLSTGTGYAQTSSGKPVALAVNAH